MTGLFYFGKRKTVAKNSMEILLTNDDGIAAPGLAALYEELAGAHALTVVAPDRERSAAGHAITLNDPLRMTAMPFNGGGPGYAVSGTPADCVKLAVGELLPRPPDVVISGINPGANVGIDATYSGTVAAAREAAFLGIPAVAVSMVRPGSPYFAHAARFITGLLAEIRSRGLPGGTFLNVNLPHCPLNETAGVRLRPQNIETEQDAFERRTDPRKRDYYWHRGYAEGAPPFPAADGDRAALARNHICVTPMKCDTTDYGFLAELNNWDVLKGKD